MKVLIITNMYPDKKDKAKGIFVKNLIDLLQKDIKIDYSIIPGSFIKNFFKGLKNTKRKIKEFNPDIIQGEYLVTGGLIAALLKNFAKKPILTTMRGSDIRIFPKGIIKKTIAKYCIKKADCLVGWSNDLKKKVIELGADPGRVFVIPNGVDLKKFKIKDSKRTLRRKLKLPNGTITVFVGYVNKLKGIQDVIKPFSKLSKNNYLMIIGKGPIENELKEKAGKLGISNRILFKGEINPEILPKYLKSSDLMILPTYSEGMPNIMLESMASGLPMILTKVGGIPDVATDENALFHEPGSEEQIYKSLKKMTEDSIDCSAMLNYDPDDPDSRLRMQEFIRKNN